MRYCSLMLVALISLNTIAQIDSSKIDSLVPNILSNDLISCNLLKQVEISGFHSYYKKKFSNKYILADESEFKDLRFKTNYQVNVKIFEESYSQDTVQFSISVYRRVTKKPKTIYEGSGTYAFMAVGNNSDIILYKDSGIAGWVSYDPYE